MVPEITLNRPQLQAIKLVQGIATQDLSGIVDLAQRATWIAPQEFEDACADVLGNSDAAIAVVRVSLMILSMSSGVQTNAEELLQAIEEAIRRADPDDDPGSAPAFAERKKVLLDLVRTEAVRRISKALDLAYEYGNLYRSSRIITDIRPIFNEGVDKITGSIVSYTFRMRYNSADGEHSCNVALDEQDVNSIKDECERALKKALLAKEHMESSIPSVRTMIAGGEQ